MLYLTLYYLLRLSRTRTSSLGSFPRGLTGHHFQLKQESTSPWCSAPQKEQMTVEPEPGEDREGAGAENVRGAPKPCAAAAAAPEVLFVILESVFDLGHVQIGESRIFTSREQNLHQELRVH